MTDLPFSPYKEAGNLVFLMGKIELTSDGKVLDGSITEKTKQTLENVNNELKNAGLGMSDVVFAQIYITDMKDYDEMNKEYMKHFTKPYPARAAVAVKELPLGAKVEIVVTAYRND